MPLTITFFVMLLVVLVAAYFFLKALLWVLRRDDVASTRNALRKAQDHSDMADRIAPQKARDDYASFTKHPT